MSKIITVDCRSKKQKKLERLGALKKLAVNGTMTTIKVVSAVLGASFYIGVMVGGVIADPFRNGR